FFFSSRRRHTRCLSDWSSDVCSSDLDCTMNAGDMLHHVGAEHEGHTIYGVVADTTGGARMPGVGSVQKQVVMADLFVKFVWPKRSEERRVGKECRSRWAGYQ